MKKKKGHGNKSDKWDQVPIGEEFYGDKEFENLISLEVLTDYQILKKPAVVDGKGSRKRKSADDKDSNSSDEEITSKSEVKKKKKKKVREDVSGHDSTVSSIGSTSSWTILEEEEQCADVDSTESNKKKKKKKSVKLTKSDRKNIDIPEADDQDGDDGVEKYDLCLEEWVKLGVPEKILLSLKSLGFEKPTPIQSLTLPAALLGKKDIVGAAETGSGKTLAFAIPIISGILNDRKVGSLESNLSALILTPTRELASQIRDHIEAIAKHSDINVMILVGGLSSQKQERLLKTSPDIIVCTPGRLWEMMKEGNEYLSNISKIRYLAVDETDRMVEKGHFKELEGIFGALNNDLEVSKGRQNFVFSATLSFTHEPPERMNKGNVKKSKQPKKLTSKDKLSQIMDMVGVRDNPKVVDITSKKGTADSLTEMQITCQLNQKDYYLYYFFLQHPGKTIVFSNSINCVRRLTNLFFHLNCETLPLHSEMHQKMRLRNLERFTASKNGILISTDVAARGLDIKDIQFVIHYQVPKTAESYIHRSGRTARVSKDGLAIILVQPDETTTFWNIFRSLGRDEMLPDFQVDGKKFRELKTQVDLACNVEKFEHMLRKKFADMNWMDKARKELDLASSDEDSDEDHHGGKKRMRKNMEKAKKELEVSKRKLAELMQANTKLFSRY